MKYTIVRQELVDGGDDGEHLEVAGLDFCEDQAQVEAALHHIQTIDGEWNLFEMVDGKAVPRSVCFEPGYNAEGQKVIKSIQ